MSFELSFRELETQIMRNEPLARHTTWKIGGPADYVITPKTKSGLIEVIQTLTDLRIPWMVLGKGSNLLVTDKGYRGAIIKLHEALDYAHFEGNIIRAGAAFSLIKLAVLAGKHGLSGFEFAGGIPGTVGGAVYMNAGANGSDISRIFQSAEVILDSGEVRTMFADELQFAYRHSSLQKQRTAVITEASFQLVAQDSDTIKRRLTQNKETRLKTQPLPFDCAGSVFRNPPNGYAAKLIEEAGLKGKRFGEAEVSSKHANFIINTGQASAADVLALISHIQEQVSSQFHIQLVPEIIVVGEK
ncbi:UDP-N-acetylenolpyruvoylglucosamine reductase [Brevibacillus reuszeri]|uniref:UDP-N-acetylenolpyruvoylglucosamine reductase n=1 Tax=Brevibacillus reuszeri TaxID=54915 RepID=A0A0K9YVS0_9BACL|nr:UDP-N-acetylmuramate dehydrogenase [Brevibacillus reuszeri]KNB72320.1 UDP-N-acetylenolpyruvoylglucosamine reductase [Brevibacillus reuszeri]MED1861033.1 UDP-N-acetylmuramate dehydrogenase [Brevibacillus reuszeri]GED72904.1 UDP-N-acetylenolpyruvoylglucosamine reductase [Brevibacillus reuszeri]